MRGLRDLPPRWTLALGPGARTKSLEPLLGALRGASETPRLTVLDDLAQLFERVDPEGRLLLDTELLPREDLGLVRRFLDRRPGWRLWLVGDDPRAPCALALCAERRARWLPWPLDVELLPHLLEPPGADVADPEALAPEPRPAAAPPPSAPPPSARDASGDEDPFGHATPEPAPWRAVPEVEAAAPEPPAGLADDELAEIEAILSDPDFAPAAAPPAARAPEPDPFATEDPARFLAAPDVSPAAAPTRPPRWYRAQVADLADLAQRLQLSVLALRERREAGDEDTRALDELDGDVARLVMFTRTLGFLAAPPPPGTGVLDLSVLLREQVAGPAVSGPDAPRFVLEAQPGLTVRSEKRLLVQVLDALFALAARCAGSADVVHVDARAEGERAVVNVTFPPGPLEGREPADVLEPYGLRRVLPEIGANALAASGAILEGQGGELVLDRLAGGRMRFRAELPGSAPIAPQDSPPGRPGGPFE